MEREQTKEAWNKQEIPKKSIYETWNEFVENSTLHGLRNSVVRKSVFARSVWSLLVIGTFSFLVYSTINSFDRFLQYPTTFSINQIRNFTLGFPAVTICSHNTADKKKILALDSDDDFSYYGLNISACAATAKVRNGTIPCGHALLCGCISRLNTEKPLIPDCDKSLQKNIINALNSTQVDFNVEEFWHTFSESWSENLHTCWFGTSYIDCSYLFEPIVYQDTICYTFNSKKKDVFNSSFPGVIGGLNIVLKTQLDRYYYPKLSQGFTVFLNEPGDAISFTGIYAGLGLLTSISTEIIKHKYQSNPYPTGCEEKTLKGYLQYSHDACYGECLSDHFYKTCGCRPAGVGVFNDSIWCYSIHYFCTSPAYDKFDFTSCICPVGCEVTTYNNEVSYGTLPHKSATGVQQVLQSADYSKENYAIINVGFKTLTYQLIQEKPAFGKTALLGEVGGNMGLLLGCSLITLVEFLDLLFSLLMLRLRQRDVHAQ